MSIKKDDLKLDGKVFIPEWGPEPRPPSTSEGATRVWLDTCDMSVTTVASKLQVLSDYHAHQAAEYDAADHKKEAGEHQKFSDMLRRAVSAFLSGEPPAGAGTLRHNVHSLVLEIFDWLDWPGDSNEAREAEERILSLATHATPPSVWPLTPSDLERWDALARDAAKLLAIGEDAQVLAILKTGLAQAYKLGCAGTGSTEEGGLRAIHTKLNAFVHWLDLQTRSNSDPRWSVVADKLSPIVNELEAALSPAVAETQEGA